MVNYITKITITAELLAHGFNFYLSLLVSMGVTAMCYGLLLVVLRFGGVQL